MVYSGDQTETRSRKDSFSENSPFIDISCVPLQLLSSRSHQLSCSQG